MDNMSIKRINGLEKCLKKYDKTFEDKQQVEIKHMVYHHMGMIE